MKRGRKRNSTRRKANQLSFDFTANVPIEIHTPRFDIPNIRKDYSLQRKQEIQLAR
ncbi:MAG: hypothetical protein KJN64_04210 [Ignavibacteria bacterium]|nr:hypothetical protein [Ignavibacteria bacterium]MBT8381153.1 hypothetical protein [Ignavibacteria bacterium]MBT8390406.1 hypothetical protein [Ignavibacteria bacterium]NNJ52596.1 hypothetical protein [Ignavibacteriaceae bacterium]NNL21651.1 hypothetical protein [Ignavibacteriaceae bacterium]